MSYEDTRCPCGNKKEMQTMLCPDCVETYRDTEEYKDFVSHDLKAQHRRYAAITLVNKARWRKNKR